MLEFIVDGQLLRRKDGERILSGGVGFLKFRAQFSREWEGYTKTFLFKGKDNEAYCVFAVEDSLEYEVPHEVLAEEGRVEVSVFGSSCLTNLATANSVILSVEKSGLLADLKQSAVATPGLYEQICHKLEETLKALPGKRPVLQCRDNGIYWRVEESSEWTLLFSLEGIRGKDGSRWYRGEEEPDSSLGDNGDFFFWENKAQIFGKNNEKWTKVFDPEEMLLPLVQRAEAHVQDAEAAKEQALSYLQECQAFADQVDSKLLSPNLFPDSFTMWNINGPMKIPTIGQRVERVTVSSQITYQMSVSGGETFRFVPTIAGENNYCYFAVIDSQENCLDFTLESIDKYTVKEDYDGTKPSSILYTRKMTSETPMVFCEVGLLPVYDKLKLMEYDLNKLMSRVSLLEQA